VIAADVDDSRLGRNLGKRLFGFSAGEGGEEQIEIGEGERVPFFNCEAGQLAGNAGESLDEFLPRAALAGSINDAKVGMG